jgi:cytochrome c553
MRTRSVATALLALAVSIAGATSARANPRGEQLFQLCAQCHGAAGEGNELFLSPSLAGLPDWYVSRQLHKFRDGTRGLHPDDVAGMRMRPMAMWLKTDEDIDAVTAYVSSLPPARPPPVVKGGDPERGKTLFTVCTACHQADAKGNEQIGAPPIVRASDWYLLSQISNFKAGIRGTRPEDAQGALMRPMAMTLVDEQAAKDVIAYIMTLTP